MNDYDYSQDAPLDDSDKLTQISQLAQQQLAIEAIIAKLEAQLERQKEQLRTIREEQLPEMLESVGLTQVTTGSGLVIKLGEDVYTSIPKARKDEAFAWLNANKFGGLIKRMFVIRFDRDQEAWANKFAADLAKRKVPVDCAREDKVEPMTLKKFVRERIESGEDVPQDLFGVHRRRVAKIGIR